MSHVTTSDVALLRQALSEGEGIVRMAPCWVPRSFLLPGGRLKLAPQGHLRARRAPRRNQRTLALLHHGD